MPDTTQEDAEVNYCGCCDQRESDCECVRCNCCDNLRHGYYCIDCRICVQCADNGNHWACECGMCRSESDWCCPQCYHYECCVEPCRNCSNCQGCCECEIGPIRDYACREYPDSVPANPPYARYPYLGVELEIEMDKYEEKGKAAQRIHEAWGHALLLKEDGSLSYGFELVTGKFSLEHHQKIWPDIARVALEAGCISHKAKSTGLHVHISRNFLSPLDIGKIQCFVNSPLHRNHIITLAGRECPNYAALKKKTLTEKSTARYEAINLCNARTIEFRLFKGTLKATRILASIEFTYAACSWVKTVSIADCEHWGKFFEYVQENRKIYPNLLAFLRDKSLF